MKLKADDLMERASHYLRILAFTLTSFLMIKVHV